MNAPSKKRNGILIDFMVNRVIAPLASSDDESGIVRHKTHMLEAEDVVIVA